MFAVTGWSSTRQTNSHLSINPKLPQRCGNRSFPRSVTHNYTQRPCSLPWLCTQGGPVVTQTESYTQHTHSTLHKYANYIKMPTDFIGFPHLLLWKWNKEGQWCLLYSFFLIEAGRFDDLWVCKLSPCGHISMCFIKKHFRVLLKNM